MRLNYSTSLENWGTLPVFVSSMGVCWRIEYIGRGMSSVNYPLRLTDPSEDPLPSFQGIVHLSDFEAT